MKKIFFLSFVFMNTLLSCDLEIQENIRNNGKIKKINSEQKDTIRYSRLQGIKLKNSLLITVDFPGSDSITSLFFKEKTANPLSKKEIDFLLSKNILTPYVVSTSYKYKIYYLDSTDTNARNFRKSNIKYTILRIQNIAKMDTVVTGTLFLIGQKPLQHRTGDVYISDTTSHFGWFTVDLPASIKPPSPAIPYHRGIYLASLDERAAALCGEYEVFPQPIDRFIRTIDMEEYVPLGRSVRYDLPNCKRPLAGLRSKPMPN